MSIERRFDVPLIARMALRQPVTHAIDVDRVCIDHADLARGRDFDHGRRGGHASASTAASGQNDNRCQDRKC